MKKKKKNSVNILGSEYMIIKESCKTNKVLSRCSGYIDWTTKNLYIRDYNIDSDSFEYESKDIHMNSTIRHEIIHAFIRESGMWVNSTTIEEGWAMNEEMVDWIAIQSPKIFKVFEELKILS